MREDVRAIWTWRPLDELTQDVRYALRTMATHRAVSIFAVLSLGARHRRQHRHLQLHGGGAAAHAAGARSGLAGRDDLEGQAVQFRERRRRLRAAFHLGRTYRASDGSVEARIFPYPGFERLREASTPYLTSLFTMFRGGRMNVLVDGQAELTDAQYVSGDFFRGIAIPPGAGRLFVADDDRPNAEPVAVISAGYAAGASARWRMPSASRFASTTRHSRSSA